MISLLAAFLAQPTLAAPVDAGRVTVELVAQDNAVAPGATVYVAVVQTMDRGWHTYWRNPGESGEATTIAWTLPDGWRAGEIVWPTPARLFTGAADNQIINYVYSDQSLLPVPISVPADARPGTTVSLRAVVSYLVCADICVPETATVTLFVPIAASPQGPDPLWGAQIAQALVQAPKPSGLTASFQSQGGTLVMGITGRSLSGVDLTGADFFAYDGALISPRAPTRMERGAQGLSFGLTPEASFAAATPPASLGGILVTTAGAFEVTAHPGPISADARGGGSIRPAATPTVATTAAVLALNMLLAFIGGLILNLMPCVFPILSMKAASLAGHGEDVQGARRQGLWFMAGVVTTFLGLALILIGARAAGAAIGWGFQLQSPQVIAALALVMLAVALNLSGVFEIGLSVQGTGQGLASRGGVVGAYFTGALAVIVAAPCTAPFMATAIGYAAGQPPAVALSVFLALALGFGAPFTALSFAPGLLRRLPRPGAWMNRLRQILAFPMYAAAGWLVWVLTIQTGHDGLARLLVAMLVLALGAYLFGVGQVGAGRGRVLALVLAGLAGVAAFAGSVWPAYPLAVAETGAPQSSEGTRVPSEPFTAERLAQLRAAGRPVFVNFTAAWCVTCQVNERAALSSVAVAETLARTGAVYLKGDWTRRDAAIAAALAEHGRDGVPLYLVYPANGGPVRILPQLLTEGAVIEALERAAAAR